MIGIVRGTRVIARNGRNVDAFEPGGSIKSASKLHGSIFSDRLDDINCHFLLDTRPILANFNCPRISAFRRTIDHHDRLILRFLHIPRRSWVNLIFRVTKYIYSFSKGRKVLLLFFCSESELAQFFLRLISSVIPFSGRLSRFSKLVRVY